MSFVIVLATSKGGAGKTTLATCLAAHWYNMGMKIAVIDADPQGSIIKSGSYANRVGRWGLIASKLNFPVSKNAMVLKCFIL
jgi:cellulose biosynthesis protein BcsQ